MNIKRIQPPNMLDIPAFSQAIEVQSPSNILFIGGQNAIDEKGRLVGPNDFLKQARQSLLNVKTLLEHAGYTFANVVDMTIFYARGNDAGLGFRAFQEVFGTPDIPPTVTVIQVAEMANPERLVEVKAIAVK